MTYQVGSIRKFKFRELKEGEVTVSEGRKFLGNQIYEAHYKEGWFNDGSLTVYFFAENGYFNFTDELFGRVIKGWGLEEVE